MSYPARSAVVAACAFSAFISLPLSATAASATAVVQQITFSSTDLDPDTGGTTLFRFGAPTSQASDGYGDADHSLYDKVQTMEGWLSPVSVALPVAGTTASATVEASGLRAEGQMAPQAPDLVYSWSQAALNDNMFRLAPHSQLDITLHYDFGVTLDTACSSGCEAAIVRANIIWNGSLGSGWEFKELGRDAGRDGLGSWSADGQLSLTLTNDTGDWQSESLSISTSEQIQSNPLPVPEPGSVSLLAAGLLGLGAVARRRSGRSGPSAG
jgi:hypothetical protein